MTASFHGEKVPLHVVIGLSGQPVKAEREILERNTAPEFGVVTLSGVGAQGFNELIEHDADVWVLLEAGARVAPRWLELLLEAMGRPGCGLAGPSTNWAWNEQACGVNATPDPAGLSRQASRLAARFGSSARSLEPLYSLGAFCYAVRREVVSTIGSADAAYEDGPCWEMDYNVRAARAGFTGLWVGASYVHRKRLGSRETLAQQAIFERNRRLYQDRLCGLRLSGQRRGDDYETHCRGDACEHFAPRELLAASAVSRPPSEPPAVVRAVERQPLVTCVMVTRDRTEFALRAVAHFRRQSYPLRELIVVEDGTPSLGARLPADSRIRLVTTGLVQSIGAVRNRGCELARGEVVVLWDDDDWHGPDRLAHQVGPILDGRADITGLTDLCWLELDSWRCWQLDRPTQERMLLHRTYGGTLAFRRRVWERLAQFPHRSLGEDAAFLRRARARGARFIPMNGREHYVYVRHGGNSWRTGPDTRQSGWLPTTLPEMPSDDLAFLDRMGKRTNDRPLVSCLMPTCDRRSWVSIAVELYARQSWPSLELVVVDDGDEPVADLIEPIASAHYVRLRRRTVLGAKRNLAAEAANGEVLAHWDDDDWYAPQRLALQVHRLERESADLVGSASLPFYDPARNAAWRYAWPDHRRPWLAGTSLVYRREFWAANRFAEVPHGEDTRFVWRSLPQRTAACPEPFVVAMIHPGNTVPKTGRGAYWSPESLDAIARILGSDLPKYQQISAISDRQT